MRQERTGRVPGGQAARQEADAAPGSCDGGTANRRRRRRRGGDQQGPGGRDSRSMGSIRSDNDRSGWVRH
ncbi:hypothetical protein EBZ80_24310 [bacterium]|nr:hypothetical protein [bacterium]